MRGSVTCGVLMVASLAGCGPLSPMRVDGGSTGGGGGGGVVERDAGVDDAGPGDAGADAGPTPSDGGGRWVFRPAEFAIAPRLSSPFVALAGTANDQWAVRENGETYHSTGGPFTLVTTLSGTLRDIVVRGSTVVVATIRGALICTGNCSEVGAVWTPYAFADTSWTSRALCTDGTAVWLIAVDPNGTTMKLRASGADFVVQGTGVVRNPNRCWFEGAAMWIVGSEGAERDGVFERVEGNLVDFLGGTTVEGQTFVAGAEARLAQRVDAGVWPVERGAAPTRTLWVVGGPTVEGLLALGVSFTEARSGYVRLGGQWTELPPIAGFGSQSTVRALLVLGPNEVVLAGTNLFSGTVVRGSR